MNRSVALVYLGGDFPPLGMVFLASWLKSKRPDVSVRIVDFNFDNAIEGTRGADIIGISCMTAQFPQAVKLSRTLRREYPKALQVLGGVHISTLPELPETFNMGCLGEGENVLVHLVDGKREGIPGTISNWLHQDRICPAQGPLDLTDYPKLDYGLMNPHYFDPVYDVGFGGWVREGRLFTSRGCPFSCAFCSTSAFWRGLRFFPSKWVRRELLDLRDNYGLRHVVVWDDLFAIAPARLKEFTVAGMEFGCQAEASAFTPATALALRDFNVVSVGFGFESGNDRVLQFLKGPRASVAKNERAVRLAQAADLRVFGSVMLGCPGETFREMLDTTRFVRRALRDGVKEIFAFYCHPYPGTKFWNGKIAMIKNRPFQRPLLTDLPWWKFQLAFLWLWLALLPGKVRRVKERLER